MDKEAKQLGGPTRENAFTLQDAWTICKGICGAGAVIGTGIVVPVILHDKGMINAGVATAMTAASWPFVSTALWALGCFKSPAP